MKCEHKSEKERFCSKCGCILFEQKLLWIPEGKETGASMKCVAPIAYTTKQPKLVWTLLLERNENKKPELPIKPVHQKNAFLEDRIHDWNIYGGKFIYRSRVSEGNVWVLLEFEEK